MKTCTGCKKEKDLKQFYQNDFKPMAKCMDCVRDIYRTRYHVIKKQKEREAEAKKNAWFIWSEIMIDYKEYNLIYTCKTTGKVFKARSTESGMAILIDPDTGEKTKYWKTSYKFKKEFKGSKVNRKSSSKPKHALPSLGSAKNFSKKFQEYLSESEYLVRQNY